MLVKTSIVAIAATLALVVPPAARGMAAGSVYDVGLTIYQYPYVKGSGSYTNGGDYTRVCVALQSRSPFGSWTTDTEECRSTPNPSSAEFSAPDIYYVTPPAACREFRTRVQAWKGPLLYIPTKYSNILWFPGCPHPH